MDMALTVAVTGPTGEIGRSAVDALERTPGVGRILGMARSRFDPASEGWTKTEYRQGDIGDRATVDALVAEADVVVHLAFLIMGSRDDSRRVNLEGTRNVFEATVAAERPERLVYTSSVAAYGYHSDNPSPLTEDVPARGSSEHYYSEQKAECEALLADVTADSDLDVYVLRPCIVAGPRAPLLASSMPWALLEQWLPKALRPIVTATAPARVLPDPGVPMQLVHHDDVASAIVACVLGAGPAGAYNLAADGTVTITEVAHALGARAVSVPAPVARMAAEAVSRLPWLPSVAEWIHVVRSPVVMDTSKAKADLGWVPAHTSSETLAALAEALDR